MFVWARYRAIGAGKFVPTKTNKKIMLNTKTIGNKIAEARKKTNISQAQLAQQLFISSQAVGKWERGESMPDITTFNRMAQVLGVDLNYFSDSFPPVGNEGAVADATAVQPDKKPNWDMSRGNWVDADFSGLKNLLEKFGSSNMQRCKFIGSDLSGLLLKSNDVQRCDFSDSNISGSQVKECSLTNNVFANTLLNSTEFTGCHIKGCDFSGANLTGAILKGVAFDKNIVTGAVWNGTTFNGTHIADVVFDGTLQDCVFENSAFSRVTFQNLTLRNTFFKNNTLFNSKSLKGIKFVDCRADRMTYEFLKIGKADLSGIELLVD